MKMGDRIKNLRIRNELSQEELGNMLGVQKSAIAKYESGRVENMKRSMIEDLAKIFNVSPAYLMGWDDVQPNTLAAHFEGEEFTPDELTEIQNFVEFVKAKRK